MLEGVGGVIDIPGIINIVGTYLGYVFDPSRYKVEKIDKKERVWDGGPQGAQAEFIESFSIMNEELFDEIYWKDYRISISYLYSYDIGRGDEYFCRLMSYRNPKNIL